MSAPPPPPSRPTLVARSNSLPSRPSSTSSHRPTISTRARKLPSRPELGRASTSLSGAGSRPHPYASLIESDESDGDEREGRNQFCRRYLSRKGSFDSDDDGPMVETRRWYMPFTSRPSSRSSSVTSSSWRGPVEHARPSSLASSRRPTRADLGSSLSSSSSFQSSRWCQHLGKTPATLGLITPSLDILSWPLTHPHPHPSSHPRPPRSRHSHSYSHRHHPRIHRASLLFQRPVIRPTSKASSSNLAASYPSPARSEASTIRPTSRLSTYSACSPPPFRRPLTPPTQAYSYSSSEEDSLPPTSYTSYLRAGRPSPDTSDRDRTPRPAKGWRIEEPVSPTRLRRRQGVPSLSFTASSRSSGSGQSSPVEAVSLGRASGGRRVFTMGGGAGKARQGKGRALA